MAVKVIYFNMTGLGEPVRLMLAVSKIQFEDHRVTKEEWAKLKPTLKWKQLPVVEMGGKTLTQSMSICRHLARKKGLCGTSEEDTLACDITVDHLEDMRKSVVAHYYQTDSEERDNALKTAAEETVPFFMKHFEQQLCENSGYLVNGKLSWADIIFLSHWDYLSNLLGEDIVKNFPKLKQHQQKLSQLPGIKEYLANRPTPPKDLRTIFM